MQSVFEDELKAYVEASNHTEDQVLKLFDRTYVNPIRVRLASTCLLLEVIVFTGWCCSCFHDFEAMQHRVKRIVSKKVCRLVLCGLYRHHLALYKVWRLMHSLALSPYAYKNCFYRLRV